MISAFFGWLAQFAGRALAPLLTEPAKQRFRRWRARRGLINEHAAEPPQFEARVPSELQRLTRNWPLDTYGPAFREWIELPQVQTAFAALLKARLARRELPQEQVAVIEEAFERCTGETRLLAAGKIRALLDYLQVCILGGGDAGHQELLTAILNRVADPGVLPWATLQSEARMYWLEGVGNETVSRARFHQSIAVLDANRITVARSAAVAALDQWWTSLLTQPTPFAMVGEEGDGKSWAVAQWITQRLGASPSTFPPLLFISSAVLNGSNRDLSTLLVAHLNNVFGDRGWAKTIGEWCRSRDAAAKRPVVVLVLDGLNERLSPDFWRAILESHAAPEWMGCVALIVTARTGYWNEHFGGLGHLHVTKYALPPFDDTELAQGLAARGLDLTVFARDLQPLLRKPRYFDLAIQYRARLIECGDFTVTRLVYEDWRDRYSRKVVPLSDTGFGQFLRENAARHRAGQPDFLATELGSTLTRHSDAVLVWQELVTSGVLIDKGGRWIVEPSRLTLGLGLLLVDQVVESDGTDADADEVIASWVEPYAGVDLQARILEHAALHSLVANTSDSARVSLLRAWLASQNPSTSLDDPVERRLIAYLPQCPIAYFLLAERIWSSRDDHPWGQEVLVAGFTEWARRSSTFAQTLVPWFERWLGMVSLVGPPIKRHNPSEPGSEIKSSERLAQVLGHAATIGPLSFAGYPLHITDDDGWLRLSLAAVAVISNLTERRPFLRALVIGAVADAVADHPGKDDQIAWTLRSSRTDLWAEFHALLAPLSMRPEVQCRQAAARLMRCFGTEVAWRGRDALDVEQLFPTPPWILAARTVPYQTFFQWSREESESYGTTVTFDVWTFIRQAKTYAAQRAFSLPPATVARLVDAFITLRNLTLWTGIQRTAEDHRMEESEVLLARYQPQLLAKFVRSLFEAASSRSGESLNCLTFRAAEYDLLLSNVERQELFRAWATDEPTPRDGRANIGDGYAFLCALAMWQGREQIDALMARGAQCPNLRVFEIGFFAPSPFELPVARSDAQLTRLIWYLATIGDRRLDRATLEAALCNSDAELRAVAMRYMYECADVSVAHALVVDKPWRWVSEQNSYESTYGSLLLIRDGRALPTPQILERIHPSYWGVALKQRAVDKRQWAEFARRLDGLLDVMRGSAPVDELPDVTVHPLDEAQPSRPTVRLTDRDEQSLTIVRWESMWGGRTSDMPLDALSLEQADARRKMDYDLLKRLQEQLTALGHHWACSPFPTAGLAEALEADPAVVSQWVKLGTSPSLDGIRARHRARTFFEALCEVLMKLPGRQTDAQTLYRTLDSDEGKINIIVPLLDIPQLLAALLGSRSSPQITALWEEHLERCCTDQELLDLALGVLSARDSDSREWLRGRLDTDKQSSIPFVQARALALQGWFEIDEGGENLAAQSLSGTWWLDSVGRTAKLRGAKARDARLWFRQFCRDADDDVAWGAFRVFLSCVDRRCWLWVDKEMEATSLPHSRRSFFKLNIEQISKHCSSNEKELRQTFLNYKVDAGLGPWLEIPTSV